MNTHQARRAIWYLTIAKKAVLWVQRMFETGTMKGRCADIREDIIELQLDIRSIRQRQMEVRKLDRMRMRKRFDRVAKKYEEGSE